MKKRIRVFIALVATSVCLVSGIISVILVEAAKESCTHDTLVVYSSFFKGYADISSSGHSELFDRIYKCKTCGEEMEISVSIPCGHSVVQYDDLGHEFPITAHPFVTYCKCGYSQNVVILCNWIVTGVHTHP